MPTLNAYQITETIFSNRFTQVFRAIRKADGLSVILRTGGEQPMPSQCARLSYVADVLKKFHHPNISELIEWIDAPNQCWLVLEDIQAIDLRNYLERFDKQRLPLEIFWPLAIQLADALSIIHHEQVIHKDLHPRNIVVNPETLQCQIIDFGLASLLSREQPTLSSPNQLEGSLSFLSPEQTGRMNRNLDYRSDFYTLGATLYLALSGKVPFEAEDALGLVYAHMAMTQAPLKEVRPDIPQALSKLIDKLLSKNAEDRYQSANGLKHDIEAIRDLVAQAESTSKFVLAQHDVSGRFTIPQLLYGREKQISILMDQFSLATEGLPSILVVQGYSGIGKSALVHEIHKPVAEQGGVFIEGKFDQFQQNIPYFVISTALESWLNQTLSLPEEKLQTIRMALLSQLSSNARVLIDFVPAFKYMLGDIASVPKLGAKESQARFNLVMKQFFKIASMNRPIVLFVDDLQWADRGTLNLLPEILGEAGCHLLIIAAFRDNEVDAHHPAQKMLAIIDEQENNFGVNRLSTINLEPLDELEISQLLTDTFINRSQSITPLAHLIKDKTNGNPFFTIEFIRTLYNDGLINFDLATQNWQWNILEIERQDITDNVVELMLAKMQNLPEQTQFLLRTAACVGTRFPIKTLARLVEQDEAEVNVSLWPALEQGLLLQEGGSGLFGSHLRMRSRGSYSSSQDFMASSPDSKSLILSSMPHSIQTGFSGDLYCRFLHDRMMQAAYESISIADLPALHLSIGRIMLADFLKQHVDAKRLYSTNENSHIPEITSDTVLFDIVEQMNLGLALIHDADECLLLAGLNQQAAAKALESGVWQAALNYSETAISLLPDNAWLQNYELCFVAHKSNAESYYLLGEIDKADQIYEVLLSHTNNTLSKAEIYAERLVQCIGSGRWQRGFELGQKGLKLLEIEVPQSELEIKQFNAQADDLFTSMSTQVLEKTIENLPENTDKAFQLAMYLLPNMSLVSAVLAKQNYASIYSYLGAKLTLEKGCTEFTHVVLAGLTIQVVKRGHYQLNKVLALASLNYLERYPEAREQANTYNILACSAFFLFSPFDEALKLHEIGEQVGLRNGELGRAAINYFNKLFLLMSKGTSLELIHKFAKETIDSGRLQQTFSAIPNVYLKFSQSLLSGDDPHALDDEQMPKNFLEKIQGTVHGDHFRISKASLAFWYKDLGETISIHQDIYGSSLDRIHMSWGEDYFFQYALLLAGKKSKTNIDQAHFDYCFKRICDAEKVYSPNYEYKKLFIEAELARFKDEPIAKCMALYEQAINAAMENGFIHYAALANERFADYLQIHGFERFAHLHAELAFRLYTEWGCAPKLKNLSLRFPFLASEGDVGHFDMTGNRYSSWHSESSFSRTLSSHSGTSRSDLDFASVMKSSQAISGELELDSLVAKVMDVILENTGAQLGALVMLDRKSKRTHHKIQPVIEAYINHPLKQREILRHEAFQGTGKLPEPIVRLVLRSGETINLANACQDSVYSSEDYVKQKQSKSILCVPIVYRDERIGVLYLENNLSVGAFTDKRFKLISMFLSQAAISFENARLFNEVNTLNTELENKVEERTRELAIANEELKAFNYTVSHDLRAPLRALTNYSHILLDEHADAIDEDAQFLLDRINKSASKMSELVSGLLDLSRIQSKQLERQALSLSDMANEVIESLKEADPERICEIRIAKNINVAGDKRMIASVLENLFNNAWKYSSKKAKVEITFGVKEQNGKTVYFVEDKGAGFDMRYRDKLFSTFQRLHHEKDFSGTGIGLATVKRIINRHGGEVWADAEVDKGARFYFTLG